MRGRLVVLVAACVVVIVVAGCGHDGRAGEHAAVGPTGASTAAASASSSSSRLAGAVISLPLRWPVQGKLPDLERQLAHVRAEWQRQRGPHTGVTALALTATGSVLQGLDEAGARRLAVLAGDSMTDLSMPLLDDRPGPGPDVAEVSAVTGGRPRVFLLLAPGNSATVVSPGRPAIAVPAGFAISLQVTVLDRPAAAFRLLVRDRAGRIVYDGPPDVVAPDQDPPTVAAPEVLPAGSVLVATDQLWVLTPAGQRIAVPIPVPAQAPPVVRVQGAAGLAGGFLVEVETGDEQVVLLVRDPGTAGQHVEVVPRASGVLADPENPGAPLLLDGYPARAERVTLGDGRLHRAPLAGRPGGVVAGDLTVDPGLEVKASRLLVRSLSTGSERDLGVGYAEVLSHGYALVDRGGDLPPDVLDLSTGGRRRLAPPDPTYTQYGHYAQTADRVVLACGRGGEGLDRLCIPDLRHATLRLVPGDARTWGPATASPDGGLLVQDSDTNTVKHLDLVTGHLTPGPHLLPEERLLLALP